MDMWCPRQESNLYLALRRRSFYPLNYGGGKPHACAAVRIMPQPEWLFEVLEQAQPQKGRQIGGCINRS